MKKIIAVFLIAAAFALGAQTAISAPEAKAGKTKAELKIDKDALKKRARTLSNGDTIISGIPLSKELCVNFPRMLDSVIGYLMPWVNLKEVDATLGAKNVDAVNRPDDFVKTLNSAMGKHACRLKPIPTTGVVIKQKIQSGVPLYWFCWEDSNLSSYLAARSEERKSAKTDDWKKLIAQKGYKPNVSQQGIRGNTSYLVVGYNAKTDEVGIAAANNEASIVWITIQEMKKYNNLLVEPTW
ncbi:MAG: hypothetical protein IKO42_05470 [Opitutales bacterium]|nr:hypothetical protein [Opitutales bacterium]